MKDIRYVAVLREKGEPPAPRPPSDLKPVRLELGSGHTLDVLAPPEAHWTTLGFVAHPVDRDGPIREVFVFRRALNGPDQSDLPTTLALRDVPNAAAGAGEGANRSVREVLKRRRSDPKLGAGGRRLKLGELLVSAGLLTEAEMDRATLDQRDHPGERIGETLTRLGLISERALAKALSDKFHVPLLDLDECKIDPAALRALPEALLRRYRALPIDDDGHKLVVALADPLALDVVDALQLRTGRHVSIVLALPSQLDRHLSKDLGAAPPPEDPSEFGALVRSIEASDAVAGDGSNGSDTPATEPDAGVIGLVNRLLTDAFQRDASDIHVEPGERTGVGRIRLRIDGECVPYHDVPGPVLVTLTACMKIMAGLDITEHRKPQDGKIRHRIGNIEVELRVATIPTVMGGEDVVLRLLPPSTPRPLEQMDLSSRNLRELNLLLASPYGLLLCVGPTGSGKTTTLHSALAKLNTPSTKIWTIEDPVEITQPGLRQVQVMRKAGLDFATGMRSFLRADPDVIMVGEMRDIETAAVAIEASLTGHLVLSTLHTNTAPETITRLLEMGIEAFSFADSLLGVLAQRLVRSICAACSEPVVASARELETLVRIFGGRAELDEAIGAGEEGDLVLWKGVGCAACGGTGFHGRCALHELLVVDDDMRELITKRASAEELRQLAIARGMTTLLQDGARKAVLGLTDLPNVLAACSR
jgi:type II secretory ATPase GspE/PulE/Tfp pilus assembly ATPase PilB-like protein